MMNEQLSHIDWRWRAVETKNRDFDGAFYFAVRTTGVFCRPSCSSRTPKRQNVSFYLTPDDAEKAGFRACQRCKPKEEYFPGAAAELIQKAFAILQSDAEVATVEDLSSMLDVTPGHLQKTFKSVIGVRPKEVLKNMRIEDFKRNVREMDVTTSLYESGFGSSRSLYEKAGESLGMTPATYKKGAPGLTINYTIAASPLGKMLVAATSKGICAVSFGDDAASLKKELETEFFAASFENDDKGLREAVKAIMKGLKGERAILTLPVDIRASVFQMRVWSELRKIPYGETRTYGQIANEIGQSTAVRAVARACATNPVAIVTPCHRVIGADGKLSGYRWGIERKKKILEQERAK